jgi:hypothetical protein
VGSGKWEVESGKWEVESGKWEAIEIMAATATSRAANIHQLIKIKKYPGPAHFKGLNLTVTSAFPSKPFHKQR